MQIITSYFSSKDSSRIGENGFILAPDDIVWGMGRSVIEGACMGKMAVVHGRWGTGGVLTGDNYDELKKTNFSGRKYGGEANSLSSPQELIESIKTFYNQDIMNTMYEKIKENHDVKKAAKQFVDIALGLIADKNVKTI